MQNIPDVHQHDRDIPPGKVLLAEYGQATGERPIQTILDTRTAWDGQRAVHLVAVTAGWAIAGSMLRWDNGYYAVRWKIDGATHGSRYKTFEEAFAHFNRLPA